MSDTPRTDALFDSSYVVHGPARIVKLARQLEVENAELLAVLAKLVLYHTELVEAGFGDMTAIAPAIAALKKAGRL